jgi:hypothetical protein
MTGRGIAVTTVNADDDDGSSNDGYEAVPELRAFAAELDEIARSLEDDARRLHERTHEAQQLRATAAAHRRHNGQTEGSVPGAAAASYRTPPPVPHSTAYQSRWKEKETSPPRAAASEDDDVPTPMQTPAPLMFSPLFDSGYKSKVSSVSHSRQSSLRGREPSKVSWENDYLVSTPARKGSASSAADEHRGIQHAAATATTTATTPTIDSNEPPIEASSQKMEALDRALEQVDRQEGRIRSLELDNTLLRSKVRDLEAEIARLQIAVQSRPSPPERTVGSASAAYGGPTFSHATRPSTSSRENWRYGTPPPSHRSPAPEARWSGWLSSAAPRPESPSTTASPGKRFVADFSRLIDVDPVYHAPLARIMDDHFARTYRGRERSEWDRS